MKHIVSFSGGIDSQRCALWVREHYAPAKSIKRGGNENQPALPILYERPACESRYGLCG